MCGIVGYVGRNQQAQDVLIDGLRRLEYRGYDSAGIAIFEEDSSAERGRRTGTFLNIQLLDPGNDHERDGVEYSRTSPSVARNASIAAGSTITKEVPEDALAISRSKQSHVAGWSQKQRPKDKLR